jgi:hypothetical protein
MKQLLALLISWVIEVPIILIVLAITRKLSSLEDICNVVILACAATLFTHPLAWESNQLLIPYMEFTLRVGLIESCVVIVEGILYALFLKLGGRQGLLLSMMANTASFFGGLLINQLFL